MRISSALVLPGLALLCLPAATAQQPAAGQPAAIRITTDSSQVIANGKDVALVHVDIVDSQGYVVPDADNLLSFSVTGEGKLLGVDNGNERDDNSFKLNSRKAFKGHAFAVIQAGRKPGDISISVQADGLPAATAKIGTFKSTPELQNIEDLK